MFDQLFGNYIVANRFISQSQFDEVIQLQNASRVKLGLIAVSEQLLSVQQANEINMLQVTMDKRFGDIATEKGYLNEEQVSHLLSLQGNGYLKFIQTLIEKNFMTLEEITNALLDYKAEFSFTDHDMEVLKSDDVDAILPLYINISAPLYNEHISLAIRNIIRFIDNRIYFNKAYSVKEYSCNHLAIQCMNGDHTIFLGFSAKDLDLLALANPYAKEEFDSVNEDAYDAVCEFINCTNGLFASKLSHENIEVDLLPPLSYTDKKLVSSGEIYVVPVFVNGVNVDLLISIDTVIDIK